MHSFYRSYPIKQSPLHPIKRYCHDKRFDKDPYCRVSAICGRGEAHSSLGGVYGRAELCVCLVESFRETILYIIILKN